MNGLKIWARFLFILGFKNICCSSSFEKPFLIIEIFFNNLFSLLHSPGKNYINLNMYDVPKFYSRILLRFTLKLLNHIFFLWNRCSIWCVLNISLTCIFITTIIFIINEYCLLYINNRSRKIAKKWCRKSFLLFIIHKHIILPKYFGVMMFTPLTSDKY